MTGQRFVGVTALLLVAVLATGVPGQGTWTRAAPLPSSRTEVTGAELGGRLYVIGGFGQGGDQVEAYDPRTDRWERRAPLPVPIHHTAAVAINGRLYVVGGYAGGQWAVLDSVFEYEHAARPAGRPDGCREPGWCGTGDRLGPGAGGSAAPAGRGRILTGRRAHGGPGDEVATVSVTRFRSPMRV